MSLFEELKRRRVFRLIAAYVVVAWVLIQVVTAIEEPLSLPDWFDTAIIVLLGIGFPIAVIMSWVYDVTPEGVTREDGSRVTSTGIDYGKIALGAVIILGAFLAGNYVTDRQQTSTRAVPDSTSQQVRRIRFEITSPTEFEDVLGRTVAISPDGTTVVIRVVIDGRGQLMRRRLDALDFEPIEGTANANQVFALSPDGQWVAFRDAEDGLLKKVPVAGGAPVILLDTEGFVRALAWSESGYLVFATNESGGLQRIPDTGGTVEVLSAAEIDAAHRHPSFIPGTEILLLSVGQRGLSANNAATIAFLTPDGVLHETDVVGASPKFAGENTIVYFSRNTLWAAAVNLQTFEIGRNPVALAEGVEYTYEALYDVSENGTLIHHPSRDLQESTIHIVNRDGSEQRVQLPSGTYVDPTPSPDGTRFAAVRRAPYGPDLWLFSMDGSEAIRVTNEDSLERSPTWSPDGRYLYFSANRRDDIFRYDLIEMGDPLQLTNTETQQFARSVSPDGKTLFLWVSDPDSDGSSETRGLDLAALDLGEVAEIRYLSSTRFDDRLPTISPDGRWLAYDSDQSGSREVYVRPYPNVDDSVWRVSVDGGGGPEWNEDGSEIFYWGPTHIMSVPVSTDQTFTHSPPVALFDRSEFGRGDISDYYIGNDRFLLLRWSSVESPPLSDLVLLQNWPALLNDASATP